MSNPEKTLRNPEEPQRNAEKPLTNLVEPQRTAEKLLRNENELLRDPERPLRNYLEPLRKWCRESGARVADIWIVKLLKNKYTVLVLSNRLIRLVFLCDLHRKRTMQNR